MKLVESWWKVGEIGEKSVNLVKLVKSWWSSWKVGKVGEKLVKLVNLLGGWSSWWSWWVWWKMGGVGEFGRGLVKFLKSWWVGQVGEKLVKIWWKVWEKLVKSGWIWWKVGEVGEVGEKFLELVKSWSEKQIHQLQGSRSVCSQKVTTNRCFTWWFFWKSIRNTCWSIFGCKRPTNVPRNSLISFRLSAACKMCQEIAPMRFWFEDNVLKLVKLANLAGG